MLKTNTTLIFGAAFFWTVCAQANPVVNTSICDLAKIGAKVNGRQIRLAAIYTTDLREHSSLNDPRCPKLFLEPFDSLVSSADPTLKSFDEALSGDPTDLRLRQFKIDAVGRYAWNRHGRSVGRLYMEKIFSFRRFH